ncbi:serine/threonine-protein kinase [Pseudobacteroides cellulosolvens]|uniref:Serine/threonine protein kinase n=1 Tax=Pseudobacteroides cellulosolvens ATCC 35603 = DSM 2933 TaxID=398512 RepID=A0A0L6JNY2_9FIRM|nr:serine/threonine-protein kinase [Pseudobacteroides cellulosolvens]KNY27494.1 serine/threonine protein kinase [Pseudobacteroides cellulosolvens ATCC 35603 = DSM 2933]
MSVNNHDYIKSFEPLWGSWKIEDLVGEGSYGKVYKISKDEWGFKYESALKHIEIPTREQYREAVASFDNNDENTLKEYFTDAVKNMVNEIRLMYTLRGTRNIICYEDHAVHEKNGEFGWDVLIRMEYATPLIGYIKENAMARQDVIRLGIDMCYALEACSRAGIIHRDIKDENIFISSSGDYKLGDFGISRILSGSGRAASMKGTPFFMAPEVYRGADYDIRSDIYSLGIVLYKLTNYGRLPFMPPFPNKVKYQDSEKALDMRMSVKYWISLSCPGKCWVKSYLKLVHLIWMIGLSPHRK